ncbi:hypothetical protein AWB75_05732 [Caballeronia catudaia]|uniref:Uncharacterized protein n=1 Tax=Caballeronia catudaia TaxID=1777136 RepID=A0A158CVW9_9BURK|nr:hypothetical protein [Caballeronia catudaia]SAK85727.1 hypothetical protein AWB75_05732 [Caballeronia catudaia]
MKNRSSHPARPGAIALAIGLLLAPAAWMVQTNLVQTIAAWGCFPHERPVHAPALSWLEPGIVTVAVLALLMGIAGGIVAWRNWRRTGAIGTLPKAHEAVDRHAARDAFIARAGALASALFVFALISTDLAWLLVSPCGGR